MMTYIMFGTYSTEAMQEMSAERTTRVKDIIKKHGGTVQGMYALLGENDLVFIAGFPSTENAMKASIVLTRETGIAFTTSPAVSVEEFDKMIGDA